MTQKSSKLTLGMLGKVFGVAFFVYLFFGFMLLPCLNTITQIFTTTDSAGNIDPLAVIRFFFAGNMPSYVMNSLKLAVCLVITVNIVGISIVLLTEYFDIKGAKILRLGYMTTLIYSGVALVTGYLFLYDSDGIMTTWLSGIFPNMDKNWFSGFNAVLFTMTFACTSNHALFLRNAIRAIDYNTVEAARNLGAKPFKVLLKVVFPTLIPTLFSLTVMTFITGLCAMSAPTLLGYDSINPEIVRLAGSSSADEAFPQARAALLSIILAMFTIILLTVLSSYERKGHYLSVSKTKAKLVKQKISNPVANVLAIVVSSSVTAALLAVSVMPRRASRVRQQLVMPVAAVAATPQRVKPARRTANGASRPVARAGAPARHGRPCRSGRPTSARGAPGCRTRPARPCPPSSRRPGRRRRAGSTRSTGCWWRPSARWKRCSALRPPAAPIRPATPPRSNSTRPSAAMPPG